MQSACFSSNWADKATGQHLCKNDAALHQLTITVVFAYLHALQAGAVDAAELAMYAALMTSTNVHMVVGVSSCLLLGPLRNGVVVCLTAACQPACTCERRHRCLVFDNQQCA